MMNSGAIMSECIDYDEVRTGKRRETTYSGVNALLTKPAVSVAHFLTLMLMVSFGYINDEEISVSEQLPSVSTGVLLAFTLVPIIFLTIAIIALKFFPLDGEKWQDQKKQLQRTHIQKENDYMEHLKKEDLI
ncbi:hypothetical protein ES708_30772 [subsurface metagenome]